ncbi:unnamed protein product [Coregonus sp. 'balchen']|nr:unnamed protein product [Coregonus sp. 'balchen']
MHNLNPTLTTSIRHTKASKAMKIEDIVLKQEQDDIWEIIDVSSNIFSPQTATNSPSFSVQEFGTSISSETVFSVDARATQGIQQIESTQLTPHLTELPHKVTGMKKRRRRNKTGWATKVKSKRPLSKVNCRDTLDVLIQSSIDNTGLNSSLCNLLTENDTLESVEQEKECRAQEVKAVTNDYNRVRVEKEINCGDQPLTARAKLQHSSVLQQNSPNKDDLIDHLKIHMKGTKRFANNLIVAGVSTFFIFKTHTNIKPNLCEVCGQRYDQVTELCVHCKVCCKSSGEERACISSLSQVWHEPQSLQNQTPEPEIDSLYNDNQEMLSTDDQHPQCTEPEPLPPLETMEEYSSDVLPQNPKPACQTPGNGLEINQPSPSNSMCASPAPSSPSVMSCYSVCVVQPVGVRSRLQTHAPCDRYSCGQCGKSFNQWNKLWLHQGLHREKRCSFSCTQCNLEFSFFGSYREHMQEHAAQRPYACPLCPKSYVIEEDLNTHLGENHQPRESLKCDTCEKGFTSFRNFKKHLLLHRGASSHYCLPCMLPFPSNRALQNHLKAHKARPVIPLPEGPLEPLLFPYRCRKCNARFTTTDLLQAHQVCHLIGGKKAYSSSSANYVSASLTSKLSNKPRQRFTLLSPQTIPSFPLSNKRNMYRYPHPDRLYVVPKISSQPPVIISDTEQEPQEILNISLSSVHDSPRNTMSLEHEGQISPSNDCCEASNSSCVLIDEPTQCTPKPQTDTTHMPTHEPPSPCPLDKGPQNVPPQIRDKSKGDHDAFFRASTFVIPRGKTWG